MTKTLDIQEITLQFGESYRFSKEYEAVKKDSQKEFFEAATAELSKQRLPRKTVEYPSDEDFTPTDIDGWVKTYHPGWKILDSEGKNNGGLKLILEQDPALMKFVYVNPVDKMVYGRSAVEGGPSLDTERLKEEDPDLYKEISEWDPNMVDWTKSAMVWSRTWTDQDSLEGSELNEAVEEFLHTRDIPRQIKDPNTWTDAQSAAVQKYMVPGQISVKLTPPRKAKKEELE